MADIIENQELTATADQQPQVDETKQFIADNMAIALNGGIVPQAKEEVIQDALISDAPPPITFESIKEKFGYEKPEDAIREIEDLRSYKATPPTPAEIKFENEQSEKIFKALQSGKVDEVAAYLLEQRKLESLTAADVTKDNAAEIIKLGMQIKYKDLTPSEIDYKFKKQFSLPKEPIQNLETDEEFEVIKSEWKQQVQDIEMDKILEAKFIRPELESHKSKLTLPEITAQVDEDYIQWKQSQETNPQIEADRLAELKTFTPKAFETKINFNDEANKVAFEYQDEPTVEEFNKTVEMVTDINKFYGKFIGQDGKPDRKSFAKAIHFAINGERMLLEAMKQAKNATLKSFLPDNGGVVRHMPQTQEVSELDANMQRALSGYSNVRR